MPSLCNTLVRLGVCLECRGAGRRWHTTLDTSTREVVFYAAGTEPTAASNTRREFKTCETCRGTGRARQQG
jgi:hypothetical protein